MRVLFSCTPLYGHLHPLLPFARALVDSGHEVAIAASAVLAPAVEQAGLRHMPAGLDGSPEALLPQIHALTGRTRAAVVRREYFARLQPQQMIPDLLALAETWSPDLFVREEREYGACIAAEVLGLPHATIGIGAIGDSVSHDVIAAPLYAHRATYGLPSDPALAMLHRYLTLRPFPPSLQDPSLPVTPTTHYLRPMLGDRSGPERLPAWVDGLPRPVVYVGLGTIFNRPSVFRAFIMGLRSETLTLIVTVGRDQDPADYGPQPDNVHIERYIPLSLLLAHCDLVVSVGGSGTVTAALTHGLPLVLVPMAADQPDNATRLAALGLGTVIEPTNLTPETARRSVLTVLGTLKYRVAAEQLRAEIDTLRGPDYAVTLLERLAAARQAIVYSADEF